MADKHNRGSVAVLVPAPAIKGKAKRINITLDEHLIESIDRMATDQGLTRSGFIATTARAVLASHAPTAGGGGGRTKAKNQKARRNAAKKAASRVA
jgi:metal-responsive CopG/Arc/MetJ family transcriptional regulator